MIRKLSVPDVGMLVDTFPGLPKSPSQEMGRIMALRVFHGLPATWEGAPPNTRDAYGVDTNWYFEEAKYYLSLFPYVDPEPGWEGMAKWYKDEAERIRRNNEAAMQG